MTNPLLPSRLPEDDQIGVFCLPHAGGDTSVFHRWRPSLPNWIALVPIGMPGRGSRPHDTPYHKLTSLVADAADAIQPQLQGPYALLGVSLGAIAAFELARELRRRGSLAPVLLCVASCRPPHLLQTDSPISGLPPAEFLTELESRYDGIPQEIRQNRELLEYYLPAVRADLHMLENHNYQRQEPLEIEILAIGGTEDPAVSASDLMGWRSLTRGPFSSRLFPGGHFFLFDRQPSSTSPVLNVVVNKLRKYVVPTE